MAGPFTESFTAANGTAVSSLSGWTKASAQTSPVVNSNGFQGPPGGSFTAAYYNTAVASAHYAKAKILVSGGGTGPAVRVQSGANSFYYCYNVFDSVYPGEVIAGSATDWDSGQTSTINAVDELSIDTSTTTTVYYKKDGATVATYTGKSALSGGFAGVACFADSGRSDDWEGGDFAGGAATSFVIQKSVNMQSILAR